MFVVVCSRIDSKTGEREVGSSSDTEDSPDINIEELCRVLEDDWAQLTFEPEFVRKPPSVSLAFPDEVST